jgi:hypothetical protein
MSLIRQINSNQIPQNGLLFSLLINDILYLGTKKTAFHYLTSGTVFNNLTPAGPLRNAVLPCKQQLLHYGPFSVITMFATIL